MFEGAPPRTRPQQPPCRSVHARGHSYVVRPSYASAVTIGYRCAQ